MVDNYMKEKGYITHGGDLKCGIAKPEEGKGIAGRVRRLKEGGKKKPEV